MLSDREADIIQAAADNVVGFATIERRRIVHCCRLEVLKESDRAEICEALLRGLLESAEE